MALQSSTKRSGSLLISVFFFVLAFVSYATFVKPELDRIFELRGSLRSKTELLEQQRLVSDQVNSLIGRFKSIKNLEEIVSMAIPVREDLGLLLSQLDILSRSSGLGVQSINFQSLALPRGSRNEGNLGINNLSERGTIQISLSLTGSYDSLKSFLKLIETNVRVLDVQTLGIAPAQRLVAEDIFEYKLTLNGYFQTIREES
jgi:Tfp pilus assembly protein PilO